MATFPPEVERWRATVAKYAPAHLVDKILWTIQHESGGNASALGDGGVAVGLLQIQDNNAFSNRPTKAQLLDPEFNIKYAVENLGIGQGNFAAWGENNLYNGKPFGALGNNPYPGDSGPLNGRAPTTGGLAVPSWADAPLTQGFGPTDEKLDSGYGDYPHFNKGNDYGVPIGTPIDATVGGTVVSAGDSGDGWGISVKVKDANGYIHNYGHLSDVNVKPGQQVAPGSIVGKSGNTGASTGPHLSYDVADPKGNWVDPTPWLSGPAAQSGDDEDWSPGNPWDAAGVPIPSTGELPPSLPVPTSAAQLASMQNYAYDQETQASQRLLVAEQTLLQAGYEKKGSKWGKYVGGSVSGGVPTTNPALDRDGDGFVDGSVKDDRVFHELPSDTALVEEWLKAQQANDYWPKVRAQLQAYNLPEEPKKPGAYDKFPTEEQILFGMDFPLEEGRQTEVTRQYTDASTRIKDYLDILDKQNKNTKDQFDADLDWGKNSADLLNINSTILDRAKKTAKDINEAVRSGKLPWNYETSPVVWANLLMEYMPEKIQLQEPPRNFADMLYPGIPEYVLPDYRMNDTYDLPGGQGFNDPSFPMLKKQGAPIPAPPGIGLTQPALSAPMPPGLPLSDEDKGQWKPAWFGQGTVNRYGSGTQAEVDAQLITEWLKGGYLSPQQLARLGLTGQTPQTYVPGQGQPPAPTPQPTGGGGAQTGAAGPGKMLNGYYVYTEPGPGRVPYNQVVSIEQQVLDFSYWIDSVVDTYQKMIAEGNIPPELAGIPGLAQWKGAPEIPQGFVQQMWDLVKSDPSVAAATFGPPPSQQTLYIDSQDPTGAKATGKADIGIDAYIQGNGGLGFGYSGADYASDRSNSGSGGGSSVDAYQQQVLDQNNQQFLANLAFEKEKFEFQKIITQKELDLRAAEMGSNEAYRAAQLALDQARFDYQKLLDDKAAGRWDQEFALRKDEFARQQYEFDAQLQWEQEKFTYQKEVDFWQRELAERQFASDEEYRAAQTALQKAQFEYQKMVDAEQQGNWLEEFEFRKNDSQRQYELSISQFIEQQAQNAWQRGLTEQQFEHQLYMDAERLGIDRATLDEMLRKNASDEEFRQTSFEYQQRQDELDRAQRGEEFDYEKARDQARLDWEREQYEGNMAFEREQFEYQKQLEEQAQNLRAAETMAKVMANPNDFVEAEYFKNLRAGETGPVGQGIDILTGQKTGAKTFREAREEDADWFRQFRENPIGLQGQANPNNPLTRNQQGPQTISYTQPPVPRTMQDELDDEEKKVPAMAHGGGPVTDFFSIIGDSPTHNRATGNEEGLINWYQVPFDIVPNKDLRKQGIVPPKGKPLPPNIRKGS